jgi:hypothetical protein
LVQEEFSLSRRGQAGYGKKKSTPAAVKNLRRSKRQVAKNDGFKPASSSLTRSRNKSRKSPAPTAPFSGKRSLFSIPYSKFPDLGVIDKCLTEQLVHTHISIPVLQKVAQELCNIPPEEVTDEKLLKTGLAESEEGSNNINNLQIAPNEFF